VEGRGGDGEGKEGKDKERRGNWGASVVKSQNP